jgi:hypothetical protein
MPAPLYQPQRDFPRVEPKPFWRDLPPPQLTVPQHVACAGVTGLVTAIFSRPVFNSHQMFFLSKPSMDYPVARKNQRMLDTSMQNWFKESQFGHGTIARHGSGISSTLLLFTGLSSAFSWIPTPYQGWVVGAMTGLGVSIVRHPMDVLEATSKAPGPKAFTGPMDVLKTAIRDKPSALSGLYSGFIMSSIGSVLHYSALFGIYKMMERDGMRNTDLRLGLYCYIAACAAETCRYPFRTMREELQKVNSVNRFTPMSYYHLLMRWKRTNGVTMCYNGFFASHPFMRAWSTAMMLFMYSHITRRYSLFVHGKPQPPLLPQ